MSAFYIVGRALQVFTLALVTPLVEKNPLKTVASDAPVVFSMARLIVLAFAVAMLHQMWNGGVEAWPEATLAIAIVLAMPILRALDRVGVGEVLALARVLLGRFGKGAVASPRRAYGVEPSKYDDHRDDSADGGLWEGR
jgi:hypothetical protein